MDRSTVVEKLKNIVAEVKNNEVEPQSIIESTDLITGLGIDSLQLINLLLSVEDEFEVEIDFDGFDITHLNSFDIFCSFVMDCISKKEKERNNTDMLFCELEGNYSENRDEGEEVTV